MLGDLAAIVEQEIALQALAMRDELTGFDTGDARAEPAERAVAAD